MMQQIILGNNLDILPTLPDKFARLIYVDPPFSTGKTQKRTRIKTRAVREGEQGDRQGFGGKQYITEKLNSSDISYEDSFDNFEDFLMPRLEAALHCLTGDGALFVHLDYREAHYIKVAVDRLIGRDKFLNEIIWAFDWGARSKTRWAAKHNNILVWALNPKSYCFNYDAMDRIPYMSAGGLVSEDKLALGKVPTDTWFHTIVGTNSKEKNDGGSYPTQKPLGILNRIIKVHSNKGDTVLDFFAGSGSTGQAAENNNRGYVLIDSNPEACAIMKNRLSKAQCIGF